MLSAGNFEKMSEFNFFFQDIFHRIASCDAISGTSSELQYMHGSQITILSPGWCGWLRGAPSGSTLAPDNVLSAPLNTPAQRAVWTR